MEVETIKGDVGMSWEKVSLDKICTMLSGNAWAASKFKDEGEIPIIRIQNLGNNENEKFIWWDDPYDKKYIVTKGDILLSLSGSIKVDVWNGIDALLNQRIVKLIPNKNIDRKWFYWQITNIILDIERMGKWALVNNVSITDLKDLEIPLPPLSTQKRIAEILDAADALRRKDQMLLKKYDELAQAIFIDMFGDPVKNEKGWEVRKLKDISTKIHSGNTPKGGSNVYVEKGITFFRSQNVWKNNLVYDDIAFIDDITHISMMKSSLKHKDILMTKTGRINTENSSLGRAAIYWGEDDKANVNGHVYLIRLEQNQVQEYVVYILTSKEYRDLIREVCVGGIDKRQLNKDHIENFPIIYPPILQQKQFQSELQNIWNQKKICENSLKNSEGVFNSLIQKAFKGELVA